MSRTPHRRDDETPCPCGSARLFAECCGACLGGDPAPTAEALMRSRYTAYVLGNAEYLLRTWHRSTRPPQIDMTGGPRWTGLEIRALEAGGLGDERGTVEFVARFLQRGRASALHETSRFVRESGEWYYVDGTVHAASPERDKVGRNAPCPCGSGRKFKRCCGA
jgi:SEC-C motif-containing protein